MRAAQERLLEAEAAYLAATATAVGEVRVARAVLEGRDPTELRALALAIASREKTLAMLAGLGERVHLCVACAEGTADAVVLLRALCDALGGKGGGQARFAQGSAPAAPRPQVEAALEQAMHLLMGKG